MGENAKQQDSVKRWGRAMCLLLMVFGGVGMGLAQTTSETDPFGEMITVNANGQEELLSNIAFEPDPQGAVAQVADPFFTIRPTIVAANHQRHVKDYINDGLTFGCINTQTRQILFNRKITVEPERVMDSGGHPESNHMGGTDKQKNGEFDQTEGNTGSDGLQFKPDYTSAEVGGEVELKLTCFVPGGVTISSTGSLFVHVRTDELASLPASHPSYVFEGNTATNRHQDTHYLRPDSLPRFIAFADKFFPARSKVIRFNDASLVWGGVFDDNGNWQSPGHL